MPGDLYSDGGYGMYQQPMSVQEAINRKPSEVRVTLDFVQWVALCVIMLAILASLVILGNRVQQLTDSLQHIQVTTVERPPGSTTGNA